MTNRDEAPADARVREAAGELLLAWQALTAAGESGVSTENMLPIIETMNYHASKLAQAVGFGAWVMSKPPVVELHGITLVLEQVVQPGMAGKATA